MVVSSLYNNICLYYSHVVYCNVTPRRVFNIAMTMSLCTSMLYAFCRLFTNGYEQIYSINSFVNCFENGYTHQEWTKTEWNQPSVAAWCVTGQLHHLRICQQVSARTDDRMTVYSHIIDRVERLTNSMQWWQQQTTKAYHVVICGSVCDWEHRTDLFPESTAPWCFVHTYWGNWYGNVPSKVGTIPGAGRGIAKQHPTGSLHHSKHRPNGRDDQWNGHLAQGQLHCCAAQNHLTNDITKW